MEVENIPTEIISQYISDANVTANNVFTSITSCQNNIVTFHGPLSESSKNVPLTSIDCVIDDNQGKELFIHPNNKITLQSNKNSNSLILSGLKNNTLIINGKINHLLMRRCENISIKLTDGTISGVDILYCKYIDLSFPLHNFTNIEYAQNINITASTDSNSELYISYSLDIIINKVTVPINPFIKCLYTQVGPKQPHENTIPKLTFINL